MPKKKITEQQEAEIKELLVKGDSVSSIAEKYEITPSMVNVYKKKFKEEGVKIESKRGRKPGSTNKKEKQEGSPKAALIPSLPKGFSSGTHFKFQVNGTKIDISSKAKVIRVNKDSIEINF